MAVLQRYFIFCMALQCFSEVYSDILIASFPNLMRAGDKETVLITIQKDNDNNPNRIVPVTVSLKNADDSLIDEHTINIDEGDDRVNSEIVEMFVNPENIPSIENGRNVSRYITVSVVCDTLNFNQDKQVLLSLDGGFFFIQTDKPIYTPKQTVRIRLISLDQRMTPLPQKVRLDIRTPQDIVIYRKDFGPDDITDNVYLHIFRFPEEPMFGNWSIVAYYGKDLATDTSVQFEVKEYVLPTFNVEINAPEYVLKGDERIDVEVIANYVYNKQVKGRSILKIGLIDPDGDIEMKSTDMQSLAGGKAIHDIETNVLGENWFEENLGRNLYLEATVLEEVTGHFENASDISVKIVSSPYVFSRDRTMNYFKKGLPFQVKTDLKFSNGQPTAGVPVQVVAKGRLENSEDIINLREQNSEDVADRNITDITDNNGQVNFNLYVPNECTSITVELSTIVEDLRIDENTDGNAYLSFEIEPHESPGNEYLVIRVPDQQTRMGDTFNLDLFLSRIAADSPVHVYVLARGKIVSEVSRLHVGNVGGVDISVTPEMVPSARIVAYFVGEQNRIIADSVKMEVQQECENDISVRVLNSDQRSQESFRPSDEVNLLIRAFPGTTVSLLAVDKAVLLLRDFHQLTSDKMHSTMETHDTGCGPGGGRNTEFVFKNAGVTVMASGGPLDVGQREGFHCQPAVDSRRKRSLQDMLDRFNGDERKRFACFRGHRRLGTGTCQAKSKRFKLFAAGTKYAGILENELEELVQIFVNCCKSAEGNSRERNFGFDFGDFANIIDDVDEVSVRKDFRESWAFDTYFVDSHSPVVVPYTPPDSITTWYLQAFGLNPDLSMCVMEPKELKVSSELFIQLKMPYSVIRNEHVEIQATVFNYHNEERAVRMFLRTPEEVCSAGTSNDLSGEKRFTVQANDAYTVTYVVIGVEIGEWPITIGIISTSGSDAVEKKLNVVAEGIERVFHHSIALNPQGVQVSRRRRDVTISQNCVLDEQSQTQVDCFDISLPPTVVPGTESCHISITGTPLGPAVTAVVTSLDKWIRLPTGCGEQTMAKLAPNVYVLQYLEDTDSGNEDIETKALSNIQTGITREIRFRHEDGSFSAHLARPSSTWLTAFVAKVFCQASKLTNVDPEVSCGAIRWIVENRRRANGAFYEDMPVRSLYMMGGVGTDDIAMTAYVLLAMSECSCDDMVPSLPENTQQAKAFLEDQLSEIHGPHLFAVVTYALALSGSERMIEANNELKLLATEDPATHSRAWGDVQQQGSLQPFWNHRRPSAISVETTGYALLAQIQLDEIDYANDIANWLSRQQNYGGGFVSTQDTVVALQALSHFASVNVGGDLDLHCNITTTNGFRDILRLGNEDLLLQKTIRVPRDNIQQEVVVTTQGEGIGTLNVEVRYNEESSDPREQCPFDMEITTRRTNRQQPAGEDIVYEKDDVLLINVDVSYLGDTNTSMGIIDFGLFTGFEPDKESCDKVLEENPLIARYEKSARSVIFYADYIPRQQEGLLSLEFKAVCQFTVSNIHHAAVKVYDYYNPGVECVQFYEGEGTNVVKTLCEDDQCTCVSSECPPCDDRVDSDDLLKAACTSAQTYVYKITVTNFQVKDGYKIVQATIRNIIKAGDEEEGIDIAPGDSREFWVSNACRCPKVRLREYLIIGSNTLRYSIPGEDGAVQGYRYVIDNNVIMKRWRPKFDREVRIPIEEGHSRCQ